MELSLFLAKVIGPVLVLVAASLLSNRRNIDLLFDVYQHPAAVYLTGVVETALGIAFVLSHNVWTPDFRFVITAIGWILLARGVGRIFFPYQVAGILKKFRARRPIFPLLLSIVLLIGAYLTYAGFMP